MSAAPPPLRPEAILQRLSERSLRDLAHSLRDGALSHAISAHAVRLVAADAAEPVVGLLTALAERGWSPSQIGDLVEAYRAGRGHAASGAAAGGGNGGERAPSSELVLSGPEVPGVPMRDTAAVFRQLLRSATREILVTGYAVWDGKALFAEAADRLDANPTLEMRLVVDLRRGHDTTTTAVLAHRLLEEFWSRHWPPRSRRPTLLYDPRGLAEDPKQRAALNLKEPTPRLSSSTAARRSSPAPT